MDRQKFDNLLQETLEEKSKPVFMSDAKRQEIHDVIWEQSRKEESVMRIGFKKKVMIMAVGMCAFGTIAALAAGKITHYYSSHSADEVAYEKISDLKNVESDTGFSVKAVEQFDSGYSFEKGYKVDVVAQDEAGNEVETFPEVTLYYLNGEERLVLTMQEDKDRGDEEKALPVCAEYKGIELCYKEDNYLFVPPSYEPSEEDRKAEAAGELYISYGSSEVERTVYHFMVWKDGGTRYLLMANGEKAPGQEEMKKMAQQIIDSEVQ